MVEGEGWLDIRASERESRKGEQKKVRKISHQVLEASEAQYWTRPCLWQRNNNKIAGSNKVPEGEWKTRDRLNFQALTDLKLRHLAKRVLPARLCGETEQSKTSACPHSTHIHWRNYNDTHTTRHKPKATQNTPVCHADEQNVVQGIHAIYLGQQLVHHCVMHAGATGHAATLLADGIDLIKDDDVQLRVVALGVGTQVFVSRLGTGTAADHLIHLLC